MLDCSKVDPVLHDRWAQGECPLIDGIHYADGTVILFECRALRGHATTEMSLRPLAVSSLDSALTLNPHLWWASLTTLAEIESPTSQVAAVCGEGSSGGDGFVALLCGAERRLGWVAFFQSSNPFVAIAFEDGDAPAVVARSSYGHVWIFPVERPETVLIR